MAIIGQSVDEVRGLLASADNLGKLIDLLGDKKPLKNRIIELEGIDDLLEQKKAILKAQSDSVANVVAAKKLNDEANAKLGQHETDKAKFDELVQTLSSKVKAHDIDAKELAKKVEAHQTEVTKLANASAAHVERVKKDEAEIANARRVIAENKELKAKIDAYQKQAQVFSAIA